jgi:hypothetical protein
MVDGPRIPRPSAERERKDRRRAVVLELTLLAALLLLVTSVAHIFWRVASRVFA